MFKEKAKQQVNKLVIFSVFTLLLAGCKKEEAPTASEDNRIHVLPQGNQPYDQQILQIYNKYGAMVLYKYSAADFSYSPTGSFISLGTWTVPANPVNVQKALDFLGNHFFNLYTDSFLRKNLPLRILLADTIFYRQQRISNNLLVDTVTTKAINGYSNITLGILNQIPAMNVAGTDSLRGAINEAFLSYLISKGKMTIPSSFTNATSYPGVQNGNANRLGIFIKRVGMTPAQDFGDYIRVICSTDYATLTSKVFTPANDPLGRFRFKYNIVVNHFLTEYGMDLQVIGNM